MPPKPFKPPRPIPAALAGARNKPSTTSASKGKGKATSTSTSAPRRASNPIAGRKASKSTIPEKRRRSAVDDDDEMENSAAEEEEEDIEIEEEEEQEEIPDPFSQASTRKSASSRPTTQRSSRAIGVDEQEEEEDAIGDGKRERIPKELLTRLLHEFMSDGMRISKGADAAVGVYVDVFVREAVARAKYGNGEEVDGLTRDFLEVEDLEKLAPQLVLDF